MSFLEGGGMGGDGDIRLEHDPALRDQIVERAKAAGLRLVRFLYCDNDGLIRGKATGMAALARRLETGIGLTMAMQAFSQLDQLAPVEGMGPVGEIRLVPDPETFVVAPYTVATGVVLVDMMTLEGAPYAADGRGFLRRMVGRARQTGIEIVAAFEPEWSLAKPEEGAYVPLDESNCFSTLGMASAAGVIDDVAAALEAQGMPVEQYYPELGWGQQELSIRHGPALRAADNHLLYREAALRVPSPLRGLEAESTNVELKASDSSANPYLSLGGVIAAGLDGIGRGLKLPSPVAVDPGSLSDEEREGLGSVRLPASLGEAIDNLQQDEA